MYILAGASTREDSKERCKDQELIQSSTTPDPGYQWGHVLTWFQPVMVSYNYFLAAFEFAVVSRLPLFQPERPCRVLTWFKPEMVQPLFFSDL